MYLIPSSLGREGESWFKSLWNDGDPASPFKENRQSPPATVKANTAPSKETLFIKIFYSTSLQSCFRCLTTTNIPCPYTHTEAWHNPGFGATGWEQKQDVYQTLVGYHIWLTACVCLGRLHFCTDEAEVYMDMFDVFLLLLAAVLQCHLANYLPRWFCTTVLFGD